MCKTFFFLFYLLNADSYLYKSPPLFMSKTLKLSKNKKINIIKLQKILSKKTDSLQNMKFTSY